MRIKARVRLYAAAEQIAGRNMPLSYEQVAEQLHDVLIKSGNRIVTIPWSLAYSITKTSRWADARTEGIRDAAWEAYGIVIVNGNSGLFVMHDEMFAPV